MPLVARLSLTFKDSLFSLALGISIFGVVLERQGHWMNHTKPLHPEYSSYASIQLPVVVPPPPQMLNAAHDSLGLCFPNLLLSV